MNGVIRREQFAPSTAFSFDDLERQGRALVTHATAQARQILVDAEATSRQRADEQQQAAYAAGLDQGRREGLEGVEREVRAAALEAGRKAAVAAAQENVARLSAALSAGLAEFEQRKHHLLATAESGLIELALAVARRVCKIQSERSTEPARANARTLLDMVKHVEDLELHVHPAELQTLQDVAADFVQSTGRQQHVTLVADPAVTRGGCVLRTRAGLIDASVESQLERIAAALCEDPSAAAPTDRVAPEGGQP